MLGVFSNLARGSDDWKRSIVRTTCNLQSVMPLLQSPHAGVVSGATQVVINSYPQASSPLAPIFEVRYKCKGPPIQPALS